MTFEQLLRAECDKILTIIGADPEQTYFGIAEQVAAWGARREADGIIAGRNQPQKG